MSQFRFLVPKLKGSPWDRGGSRFSADVDWPRIGIFCRHEPHPWLMGSLVVDGEWLEQTGNVHWRWDQDFLTGDGYLIRLNREGGAGRTQYLVGNTPRDREHERSQLKEALRKDDSVTQSAITAKVTSNDATTRGRYPMACGICDFRRVFRSEKVQAVAATFWEIGYREVDLATFAARVDRRA